MPVDVDAESCGCQEEPHTCVEYTGEFTRPNATREDDLNWAKGWLGDPGAGVPQSDTELAANTFAKRFIKEASAAGRLLVTLENTRARLASMRSNLKHPRGLIGNDLDWLVAEITAAIAQHNKG